MEWLSVREVTIDDIEKTEEHLNFRFPDDFRECALKNNHGVFSKHIYHFSDGSRKTFSDLRLITFDVQKRNNSINLNDLLHDMIDNDSIIAIMKDDFGNFVAYERATNKIVFFEHEIEKTFFLADDWTSFINSFE